MIKILLYLPFMSFLVSSEETRTYSVEELCVYDEYCRYAFDESGKTYPVKPEVRFVVANFHESIVAAGTRYGVDPRAIAGSIAAENTLNVQLSDEIQNYIAQNGVTSIAGHEFTYGLGQMSPEAAMIGEQTIAKIEGRPPRSRNEVERAMSNPLESVKLVAGIIRNAQDVYAARGIDISKRPDILATLYNLGQPETRVNQVSAQNPPRSNYFGAFVTNNMTEIQDTIGWSPEKGKYQPLYLNSTNYTMNRLSGRPMSLVSRPPTCSTQETATREAEVVRGRTFNAYRQTGQITSDFVIIDQAIDCEMQRWVLVQTSQGSMGWVKQYDLEQRATMTNFNGLLMGVRQYQNRRACQDSINQCLHRIAEITGTTTTLDGNLMNIIVNAPEGVTTPSIKDFYPECLENQVRTNVTGSNGQNNNNNNNYGYPSNYKKLTGIQLRQMRQQLEDRKKEILRQMNLTKWDDVPADFREVFSRMEQEMDRTAPRNRYGEVEVTVVNTDILNEVLHLHHRKRPQHPTQHQQPPGGPDTLEI